MPQPVAPRQQALDDLGLFGPSSVSWRVHAEPILALAGLRALFLQSLHPRAMWGVAQNSRYRDDPYGRLLRTGTYVATVVYGTTAEARVAGRRLRAIHGRMRAVDPRSGERYRIDEPDLLRWVHVTEVESFVTTIRRAGSELSDADVDRYYTEQLVAAELVGLDPATVPSTAAEIAAYYDDVRPELAMTKEAAESALFLTAPPMPYKLGFTPVRLAWFGIASTAVGLLPPWARRLYGLPGLPTTDPAATLSARTLRLALRALPDRALHGPIYSAAMRRAAAAGWPSR
ncbi:MAG TPA: oxygenase MpaB family protein [Micromonosporaceae bacterium]|nr:oxygenase MpaB family protein [Micromonosporaceae bacterium]